MREENFVVNRKIALSICRLNSCIYKTGELLNVISCPHSALPRVMASVRHRDAVEIAPKDFEDQTCGILAPALWVRIQRVSARHPNEP